MKKISIGKAVELLKSGEPVAFPTETVYGLGADAHNPSAIRKVFSIKGRPADNPLIVHIASREMLSEFAEEIPPDAEKLMDAFWPGPLTLIFRKKPGVLDLITAGLPGVALRWPSHPLSQELIARAGALVAPSANSSGRPSPTRPEHVKKDFGADFPVVGDGATQIGLESTVLDVSAEPFQIYRPGKIGKDEIEEVLGKEVRMASQDEEQTAARSPGTKYVHYAPDARVRWLGKDEPLDSQTSLYLIHSLSPKDKTARSNVIHYEHDYERMARELYDRFREADLNACREIVIEPFDRSSSTLPAIADALVNRIDKAIN